MSMGKFSINQRASVGVGRKRGLEDSFKPSGIYVVEHWRQGLLLETFKAHNGVTNEGKDDILDVYFDVVAKITTWYMALIDLSNFTALAPGDTYDNIDQAGNGWDEFKTYTDPGNADSSVTRPVWNPDPASAQSISNSSQTVFDITGSATVKGLAIVGRGVAANTKGDHAADGTLWSTALFDQGDTVVVNGDQLKITYTVNVS